MKTGIFALFVLLILSGFVFADEDHEADQIVIKLATGVNISTINARYSTTTTSEIVPGVTYKVQVSDPGLLDSTLQQMQQDSDLVWSEFSYENEDPTRCPQGSTDCNVDDANGSRRTLAVIDGDPNPSKYHDQGAFNRIKAAEAHNYSTGAGVIIAVIDTGVDYDHPDLTDHVLRDSNNQVVGWDFVDNDSDPMDAGDGIDNDGDSLIDEGAGHGTHVAGIIALVAPGAKIVPIRVLDTEGSGTADHVGQAITWFDDPNNTALAGYEKRVVNLSLGIPNVDHVRVIDDFVDDEQPTVVASSGNDNSMIVHYPATRGDALSISAVGPDDVKADFSNFDDVDVAAPGVGIYSTFIRDENGNPQWAWWSGTSMATPFVTGEVALIKSMLGPSASTDEIENAVKDTVDDISNKNPGIDIGSGRINLLRAVQSIQQSAGITIKKAVYKTKKQKLIVKAISPNAPNDVLTVLNFGTMTLKPGSQVYTLKMTVPAPAPATVTITSSSSASQITTNVIVK